MYRSARNLTTGIFAQILQGAGEIGRDCYTGGMKLYRNELVVPFRVESIQCQRDRPMRGSLNAEF
jgi:hypothetical protein